MCRAPGHQCQDTRDCYTSKGCQFTELGEALGAGYSGMSEGAAHRNCPNLKCPQGREMCETLGCAAYREREPTGAVTGRTTGGKQRLDQIPRAIPMIAPFSKFQLVYNGQVIAECAACPIWAGETVNLSFSLNL